MALLSAIVRTTPSHPEYDPMMMLFHSTDLLPSSLFPKASDMLILPKKTPLVSNYQDQKSAIERVHKGIFWIAVTSTRRKNWDKTSALQDTEIGLISSAATVGGFWPMQAIGLIAWSLGIQFCDQICVEVPSPILVIKPIDKASLPSISDRHICDGWGPKTAFKMSPSGK